MTRLVVGAHLDDAAASCGEYLAWAGEPVVTVFAGVPTEGTVTDYDRRDGRSTMHRRRWEDDRALDLLGCDRTRLDYLDRQYDPDRALQAPALAWTLFDVMRQHDAEGIVGPLGLQHPDHHLVGDACVLLAHAGIAVWLYEDLPYRVHWPELVEARLAPLREQWTVVPDWLGDPDGDWLEAKERAVRCYQSQRLPIHSCLVPERYWRLNGEEREPCGSTSETGAS